MELWTILVCASVLVLLCWLSEVNCSGQSKEQYIYHTGFRRTYHIHVPPDYDPLQPVPLVLIFHGSGGTGIDMERICGLDTIADVHRFIAVYPNGLNRCWNDGRKVAGRDNRDDVGFIRALIDAVTHAYNINPQRIYACGISNGGFFTQYLACTLNDKIAAVASIAASVPESPACQSPMPVPIIFFLGDRDPVVPYQGGKIRALFGENKGFVRPAAQSVDYWIRHNRCDSRPSTEFVKWFSGRSGFECKKYRSAEIEDCVVCYTLYGGGHTWPGGAQTAPAVLIGPVVKFLEASPIIWEYFAAHPLRPFASVKS